MNSTDTQPGSDPPGFETPGFETPGFETPGFETPGFETPGLQTHRGDAEEYFDPDAPDMSEQEFSASLEAPVERPRFVVDRAEEPARVEIVGDAGENQAATSVATRKDVFPPGGLEPISQGQTESVEPAAGDAEFDWRDQVSATVSRYRSRKPRQDRYPSLQFQFEASPLRDQTPGKATLDAPAEINTWVESPEARAPREAPIVLEATARVLEFPRPVVLPSRGDELADPVMGRPRIVEAPELLPPPPALGGILIESAVAEERDRLPGLDVPLQSSPFSLRLLAGVIDAAVVGMALGVFGYIFLRMNGAPPWRIAAEIVAALLAVLWPAYQYAFLVFSKTTPGLRVAKLEVTRFDGGAASRGLRRWRVLASLLSCASLGLGYAWCFLDEDQLSWHDRITRTHLGNAPTARPQGQLPKQPRINAD